ncbi:MAG: hypothetical protein LBN97_00790 [Oscillospiraceae bacterium]|jgi:hypothetical protein|nr:hypothetical protein [Oscillospiraceae bacterium]
MLQDLILETNTLPKPLDKIIISPCVSVRKIDDSYLLTPLKPEELPYSDDRILFDRDTERLLGKIDEYCGIFEGCGLTVESFLEMTSEEGDDW